MKYCKDCKYFKRFFLADYLSRCTNPKLGFNEVTGKKDITSCRIARMEWVYDTKCGPDAVWFEPKPPSIFFKLFKS